MYGRLLGKKLNFTILTECASSGRQMEIEIDSDLNMMKVTEGSEPVISLTIIDSEAMKEKSIVDIF